MDGLKARLSFDAVAYDYDDEYLTIDTDTHTININNVSRLFGVQYDGNSKLIKFRIRNKLSDIQKMQDSIVYINWIDSKGVKGQSIAINKTINNDTCEFAWKVPFDALKNSGVLHFAMSAVITENGSSVINQKWSTQIASVITPDGIYIKSYTPSSEEEDRIAQIYNELSKMINKQNDNLQSQVSSLKEDLIYQQGLNTRLVFAGDVENPVKQVCSDYIEFLPGTYRVAFNFSNTNKRIVSLKKRNRYWVNTSEPFEQKLYSLEFTVTEPFEALILVQGEKNDIEYADVNEIILYIKDTTNKLINYFSYLNNQLKNPIMENYKMETKENGYYNKNNVFVGDKQYNCKRTELIKIEAGDKYLYKGVGKFNSISVIWYSDINEDVISSEAYESGSSYKILTPPINAKYVRFFSFADKKYEIVFSVMKYLDKDTTTGDIDRIRTINDSNVLFNKTWVVCGDSWTAGDFRGLPKEQYYDENYSMNKAYPYFIGKRNSMNIIVNAINGSTMAITKDYLDGTVQDKNFREPFSNTRYKNIKGIENADYITLMFGINDKYHSNIGTINDETNETFYGAWNVVLKDYITNYPNAKIGVIIYSGDISTDIHQALIAVSKNNGIPYLDLNSTDYPLIVNQCEDYVGAKQSIVNIRNSQNFVSASNNHPNVRAQEKFSYIIEEWLKSI